MSDLNDILSEFTKYVASERTRSYNAGMKDGTSQERERCAKIAEGEILLTDGKPQEDLGSQIALVVKEYILSGAKAG